MLNKIARQANMCTGLVNLVNYQSMIN